MNFISNRSVRRWLSAGVMLLALLAISPAEAWYYFVANNSERTQWVFNSSCNPGSGSINLYVDSDTPAAEQNSLHTTTTWGPPVITDWNEPFSGASIGLINTSINTSISMTSSTVVSFHNSPTAGQLWIVYDSDGSVFSTFGLDPTSGILGVGVTYSLDGSNPHHVCAGLVLINALFINANYGGMATRQYKVTALHEIGHAMGFAHSVSAYNNFSTVTTPVGTRAVMYPFSSLSGPTQLQNDDHAGARAVYGQ